MSISSLNSTVLVFGALCNSLLLQQHFAPTTDSCRVISSGQSRSLAAPIVFSPRSVSVSDVGLDGQLNQVVLTMVGSTSRDNLEQPASAPSIWRCCNSIFLQFGAAYGVTLLQPKTISPISLPHSCNVTLCHYSLYIF